VMVRPASSEVRDGGATAPRTVDFPTVRGILPVQAKSGGVAPPTERSARWWRSWDPGGPYCNFLCFLGCSV
jgi:hypothetical protein